MDHHTMLTDILKLYLDLNLARAKCLSALILALFKVKTVNLTELATAFPGRAQSDSHYRRLQRFFQHVNLQPALIAQVVVAFLPDTTYTLALDRTNWMLGCLPINFLVLSVVHQGTAFPIFWTFLPKRGSSNTQERIALLNRFLSTFGAHKIDCLLADREFIGERWFAYLTSHQIRFRIRIKRNIKIARSHGTLAPAYNFFRSLPVSASCTLHGARLVCGQVLWVTGMRLPCGDYLIVVSDEPSPHVMAEYQKRWKIEVLFEALKSRGFNFEDTHLQHEDRLKTLFSVLTLAFCWAYHVGAWRNEVKPIRIKKHQRPEKSIFRYGFDWIRQRLLNPQDKPELLTHVLNLLWQVLTGSKAHIYHMYPI